MSESRFSSRTALVVAALVIVSSAGYGLFVHDPAPASPAPGPITADAPLDLAAAAADSTFAASMSYETFGPEGFSVRRQWAFDGSTMRSRITFEGGGSGTVENVVYGTADATYRRYHAADPSVFESRLESAENVVGADEAARVYYVAAGSDGAPDGTMTPGLPFSVLSSIGFERVGTTTYQGREVVEYTPETGWTKRRHDRYPGESKVVSAYVESASGTVLVDAETGTPYVANVSATLAYADSWAVVLLHGGRRVDVTYRVDLNGTVDEAPAWVTRIRANESAAA